MSILKRRTKRPVSATMGDLKEIMEREAQQGAQREGYDYHEEQVDELDFNKEPPRRFGDLDD